MQSLDVIGGENLESRDCDGVLSLEQRASTSSQDQDCLGWNPENHPLRGVTGKH